MAFQDHFSERAAEYARFRPRYPTRLFQYLADAAPARDRAWDCGTGSGQAAAGLAPLFRSVIATDPSAAQLAAAEPHPHVEYRESAEGAPVEDASVDLVAAASAAHWFDLERFYAEVRRVAKPHGLVALWCYSLPSVDAEVDAMLRRFATEVVGPSWPPERRYVDRHYRTLPFPFREFPAPSFRMEARWSLADLIGYVRTWSAVRQYREARGRDPIDLLEQELAVRWDEAGSKRTVTWPIHLRVGRVA